MKTKTKTKKKSIRRQNPKPDLSKTAAPSFCDPDGALGPKATEEVVSFYGHVDFIPSKDLQKGQRSTAMVVQTRLPRQEI